MNRSRDRFVVLVHVLLEADDSVLLLRRARTGRADGSWAPPGGHLERGELPRFGAVRECAEEVGVVLATDALRPIATLAYRDADDTGFNLVFAAPLPDPATVRCDASIASAHVLASVDALPQPCVPWLADVLARRRALRTLPQGLFADDDRTVPWFGESGD